VTLVESPSGDTGVIYFCYVLLRGGAPIGAGGHDPPLLEAKGDGGT